MKGTIALCLSLLLLFMATYVVADDRMSVFLTDNEEQETYVEEELVQETKHHTLSEGDIHINNHETHVFEVPAEISQESDGSHWFLTFTFQLTTEETARDFDDPTLEIRVDDQLVYRLAAYEIECAERQEKVCQTTWLTRTLVLKGNDKPKHISVWSGDSGDDLLHTTAIVKELNVYAGQIDNNDPTVGALSNYRLHKDNENYLSVEWNAPPVFVPQLDRSLRYEFKVVDAYSEIDNWHTWQDAEVILPVNAPQLARVPGDYEQRLFRIPSTMARGYLLMRAVDWQGKLGPIAHLEF